MSRGFHLTAPERTLIHADGRSHALTLQLGLMLDGARPMMVAGCDLSAVGAGSAILILIDGAPAPWPSRTAELFGKGLFGASTDLLLARFAAHGLAATRYVPPLIGPARPSTNDGHAAVLFHRLEAHGRAYFDALSAHQLLALRRQGVLRAEHDEVPT